MREEPTMDIRCDHCSETITFGLGYRTRGYTEDGIEEFIKGEGWFEVSEDEHVCDYCLEEHSLEELGLKGRVNKSELPNNS